MLDLTATKRHVGALEMPGDGMAISPELASKFVRGHTKAMQLGQLVQLGWTSAVNTVVARLCRSDLPRWSTDRLYRMS